MGIRMPVSVLRSDIRGRSEDRFSKGTKDHSPIRQTFELGKFISTARKSIINLIKL